MSHNQVTQRIAGLFADACVELFQSLNYDINPIDETEFDVTDVPHGKIAAGCKDFAINIHLHLPFPALAMTYPVFSHILIIDQAALEDWLCELSNRLMGKLKRKLFACNANIAIGLPSHSMGDADKYSTAAADYVAFKYKIDQQVFICGIAIEVFHDPLLLTSQPMSDNGIPDGNIDLF
ncbi:MAG: hypothetical protein V4732_22270 [Pseudomonadota bacterium]